MKAHRQYQKTQGYAGVRTRLGFTQEMMALQLGISRSMLCRVECGNRKLPLSALVKMAELQKCLLEQNCNEKADAMAAMDLQPTRQSAVVAACSDSYKKQQQASFYLLQYELSQLQSRHKQLQENMQQLLRLRHAARVGSIEMAPALLEMQYCKLLQKIKSCDEMAQQKLQRKIAEINVRLVRPEEKIVSTGIVTAAFTVGLPSSHSLQELLPTSPLLQPTLLPLRYGIFKKTGWRSAVEKPLAQPVNYRDASFNTRNRVSG